MKTAAVAPHQKARRVYQSKPGQVVTLVFLQIITRAIAFTPFFLALLTGDLFGLSRKHAPALGYLLSLPLYTLLVMPFRFQAGARMAGLYDNVRQSKATLSNYLKWLRAALLRLLRALPFVLPFMAYLITFYYYMRVPGFNDSLLAISNLGKLVGGDYSAGIVIIALAGLITLALATLGWLRDIAFEQQPVIESGIRQSLAMAKQVCLQRKSLLRKTILTNSLLSLPAILGVLGALAAHLLAQPSLGILVMDFLNIITIILTFTFPAANLLLALAALLILWLPLLPLRKLALHAVLVSQKAVH